MVGPLSAKMERVRTHLAKHLDGIREVFKAGVKITVVVRTPDCPDRDFIMTDDNEADVINAIWRRMRGELHI